MFDNAKHRLNRALALCVNLTTLNCLEFVSHLVNWLCIFSQRHRIDESFDKGLVMLISIWGNIWFNPGLFTASKVIFAEITGIGQYGVDLS